jgi:4-hydroxy-2-oxoglutarate aldolase
MIVWRKQLGIAGIKFGCDLNGYYGGKPRLPFLPLTGEEQDEIEGLMQGMRN